MELPDEAYNPETSTTPTTKEITSKPLSQQIEENKYKLLWDSLKLGCEKLLATNPNDLRAKYTLEHMELIELISKAGQDIIKAMEEAKEKNLNE